MIGICAYVVTGLTFSKCFFPFMGSPERRSPAEEAAVSVLWALATVCSQSGVVRPNKIIVRITLILVIDCPLVLGHMQHQCQISVYDDGTPGGIIGSDDLILSQGCSPQLINRPAGGLLDIGRGTTCPCISYFGSR